MTSIDLCPTVSYKTDDVEKTPIVIVKQAQQEPSNPVEKIEEKSTKDVEKSLP